MTRLGQCRLPTTGRRSSPPASRERNLLTVHRLTKEEARRVAVRAQVLDARRPTDLVALVQQLTMLQVDPTAAIAPSADLVAWSRLGSAYRPTDLQNALERDRTLFEHNAVVRPMSDLGLYLAGAADFPGYERSREWLRANDRFRLDLLERLAGSGPLTSREIPDTCVVPWASTGWTNNRNVTQMLEFLMARGEVAISGASGASGSGTWPSACTRPTSSSPRSTRRFGGGTSGGSPRSASPGRRRPPCRSSRSTSARRASRRSSRA